MNTQTNPVTDNTSQRTPIPRERIVAFLTQGGIENAEANLDALEASAKNPHDPQHDLSKIIVKLLYEKVQSLMGERG